MSTDSPTVAARRFRLLQWINDHYKGKQAAFVEATKINQGELSLLLKNKSFGEKRAASIELISGMPPGYLVTPLVDIGDQPRLPIPGSNHETATSYRVPLLDAEAKMGDGAVNSDCPDVVREIDFDPAYIRALLGFVPKPGRLKLVTGRGDSMAPTIQPGDVVLVDTGCESFQGDGLYLINTGDGQQIKRLQSLNDGIHVLSSNPEYRDFKAPEHMIIGGKVYLRNRMDRLG